MRANVWKEKFGHELVFKFCACDCGRGSLRKDLDYYLHKEVSQT